MLPDVKEMPGKPFLRAVLIFMGISGFVMLSFGVVLLVLMYPMTFLTVGLMVLGTGQLVIFCCPHQEKRILFNIIVLNLAMVFLLTSGLLSCMGTEAFMRTAGLVCFLLGTLINAAHGVFLAVWIISETNHRKQDTDGKILDEYLDAVIQAKLLKYRNKLRNQ